MIEGLISDYRDAAIMHGDGTFSGDSKIVNQAFDRLQDVLKEISDIGEDEALLKLFSDDNVWVQLWSAAHSLETDERNAKIKLQNLADAAIPIASMNARYTLQEWDSGSLKFRS